MRIRSGVRIFGVYPDPEDMSLEQKVGSRSHCMIGRL